MKRLLGLLCALLFSVPAMSANLPAGYTEVEYLESSGTQYIDTGFYYTNANHKAVVKFSHVEPGSGAYPYWVWGADGGGSGGAGSRTGGLALQSSGTKIGVGVGSAAVGTTTYTIDNPSTPITVSVETKSNNTFTVIKDGVTVYTDVSFAGSGVAETPVTETLFGVHSASSVSRTVATRIYFAQFYDNGSLVHDFVPARNSSGVLGMYDLMDNNPATAFHTNAGTGTFTGGNPVCPNGGTAQTYTTATGTVTQNGTPTPTNPITPTFYTQGNMVLRKIDDTYKDSYDATTGKITRRVGVKVLNGTEEWILNTSNNNSSVYSDTTITDRKIGVNGISTHFVSNQSTTTYGGSFYGVSSQRINYAIIDIATDVASWKTWLSSHPVTIYYPLATAVEEDWPATQCEGATVCKNLLNSVSMIDGYIINDSGVQTNNISGHRSDFIPASPNTVYTYSGVAGTTTSAAKRLHAYNANKEWIGQVAYATLSTPTSFVATGTTPANTAYLAISGHQVDTKLQLEEGATATVYTDCKIKIATTKYNTNAFSGVVTALNTAIDKIKDVVSNTIAQTTAVANLHSGKQTKPTDACPNGKICLLVEDQAGTPHWYEIIERAPGIVPAGSGYTQVEYLQSSGTQYIDTGIVPSAGIKASGSFAILDTTAARNYIFGTTNGGSGRFQFSYSSQAFFGCGGAYSQPSLTVNTNRHNFVADKNTFTIDGNTVYTPTSNQFSGDRTIVVFGLHDNSNITNLASIKVWSLQIYNDESLVQDLVPARRDSDGVLGMYDTVSGNFFTNQGSGKFYAPDQWVPSTYTKLEYIESPRGAYIDTGVTYGKFVHDIAFIIDGQRNLLGNGVSAAQFWEATNADKFIFYGGNINIDTTERNIVEFTMRESDASLQVGDVVSTSNHTSIAGKSYWLFGLNSSYNYSARAKLYNLKVYDLNGKIVRDMVPVKRNSDNEVGLYDNVNDVFYTNQGSDKFYAPGERDLPAGYTKLQYIEARSSGPGILDTLTITRSQRIEIDLDISDNLNSQVWIAGHGASAWADQTTMRYNSGTKLVLQAGGTAATEITNATARNARTLYTLDILNHKSYVNGSQVLDFTNFTFNPQGTWGYLCYSKDDGTLSGAGCTKGKLYSVRVYNNNALVRDLVPAQHGNDVGMYDLVNNQFYTNQGTGTFTAGPAVQ